MGKTLFEKIVIAVAIGVVILFGLMWKDCNDKGGVLIKGIFWPVCVAEMK